jgi:hypothetical protein
VWPEAAVEHCDRQHGAGGAVAHDAGQPLCLAGHMHVQQAGMIGVCGTYHLLLLWLLAASRRPVGPSRLVCHIYGTEEVSKNLFRCPL